MLLVNIEFIYTELLMEYKKEKKIYFGENLFNVSNTFDFEIQRWSSQRSFCFNGVESSMKVGIFLADVKFINWCWNLTFFISILISPVSY